MTKVLALNRGEIAIRIYRAAAELGFGSVGIYSKEDRLSLHRFKADESYQIGGPDNPVMALRLPGIDLGLPHDAARMLAGVAAQAQMVAYTDTYWMLCLIAVVMIPAVMVMRPMRRGPFVQKQTKGG